MSESQNQAAEGLILHNFSTSPTEDSTEKSTEQFPPINYGEIVRASHLDEAKPTQAAIAEEGLDLYSAPNFASSVHEYRAHNPPPPPRTLQ
jgi:hypothetical protein